MWARPPRQRGCPSPAGHAGPGLWNSGPMLREGRPPGPRAFVCLGPASPPPSLFAGHPVWLGSGSWPRSPPGGGPRQGDKVSLWGPGRVSGRALLSAPGGCCLSSVPGVSSASYPHLLPSPLSWAPRSFWASGGAIWHRRALGTSVVLRPWPVSARAQWSCPGLGPSVRAWEPGPRAPTSTLLCPHECLRDGWVVSLAEGAERFLPETGPLKSRGRGAGGLVLRDALQAALRQKPCIGQTGRVGAWAAGPLRANAQPSACSTPAGTPTCSRVGSTPAAPGHALCGHRAPGTGPRARQASWRR